jgi:catechol-2,3-dioxygenase
MSSAQGSITPVHRAPDPIDPGVRIGHTHLRTADIDRIRHFYVDVLGFDVVAEVRDVPGWGTTGDILFVSAGGYHHTSVSTPGNQRAGLRSPTASPGCITSPSLIRPAGRWPTATGA